MNRRKTHEEFIEELYSINPNIEVIGEYTRSKDNIKVGCLKCGGEWKPIADSLLRGNGCPFCCPSPRKILVGFNDMWTTNPELAKLLVNPEDGYKYTQCSIKKVDWKCNKCGQIIKNKGIDVVFRCGLQCRFCSDGISYSEKFMTSLLNQIKVDFRKEKTFKWSQNKKYDFYILFLNCIIETHGIQHYENSFKVKNLKEEQENDKFKKDIALKNNIKHYIVIDCRKSELEFIKNNIISSKLNDLFDLSNINWLKCHEYACSSLVKKTCDLWSSGINNTRRIAKILNVSVVTIIKYLKQGTVLNWCNYNPVEVSKENLKNMRNKSVQITSKKVICLETNQIFNSINEASRQMNCQDSHISQCCRGIRNYCGKLEDGTKLHWEYA